MFPYLYAMISQNDAQFSVSIGQERQWTISQLDKLLNSENQFAQLEKAS